MQKCQCLSLFLQVDCETIKKWLIKNSAESENLNWIIANTKPCPKCKRPIEKNQGCMHMTCSQCKHQFCWLCLADYARIFDEGNSAHKKHCQYYRPEVDPEYHPEDILGANDGLEDEMREI